MNSDTHIHLLTSVHIELSDGYDHRQTHFNAASCMIRPWFRTSRNTVIAITFNEYNYSLAVFKICLRKKYDDERLFNKKNNCTERVYSQAVKMITVVK